MRTVITLAAAAVIAVAANWIVAITALAAGATPFSPLMIYVFGPFTIAGIVAGFLAWGVIRNRSRNPHAVLRVLVPSFLVLSFVPDIGVLASNGIPGTSVTGVVGLMIMHAVVAAVALPVFQRLAPVTGQSSRRGGSPQLVSRIVD